MLAKLECTDGQADLTGILPFFVFVLLKQILSSPVLLSCQPRVTVMSHFVYKVIRDLESMDHLCINPIHRIGLIHM